MSRGRSGWRRVILAMAAVMLAACQQGATGNVASSPSSKATPISQVAWPAGKTFAVYDGPDASGGHTVYAVGFDGTAPNLTAEVVAKKTFARRTSMPAPACGAAVCGGPLDPPYVSLSKDAIYVLDGDTALKALLPNGTPTDVRSVPGSATARAAFAVSPDDSQIAIAVISYGQGSSNLFVENLRGGGHVDVMTSSGTAYWPVGWHAGKIVLASGRVYGGTPLNPYNASGYALVDPTAGAKPMPLGPGDCTPGGTLVAAGSACVKDLGKPCLEDVVPSAEATPYYNSCLRRLDWSGGETVFLVPISARTVVVAYAALSVDGRQILTDDLGKLFAPISPTHGGDSFLPGHPGIKVPESPSMGWIDDVGYSFAYVYPDGVTRDRIVGAAFAGVTDAAPGVPGSPVTGLLIGTLPANL